MAISFVLLGLMFKRYVEIRFILAFIWFFKRFMIIKEEGCLRLLKSFNGYQLSMCKSFPKEKRTTIFRSFLKSIQSIFDEKTIKKLKGKMVYINTHSRFCRGVLILLTSGKSYNERQLEELARIGSVNIGEHQVLIKRLRDRKNLMLASSYPIWPDKEQLDEFQKNNRLERFYEMRIPIELIEQINTKK